MQLKEDLHEKLCCLRTCGVSIHVHEHMEPYIHVCSLFTGIALLGYTKELAEGRGCKETRVEHVPVFLYSYGFLRH